MEPTHLKFMGKLVVLLDVCTTEIHNYTVLGHPENAKGISKKGQRVRGRTTTDYMSMSSNGN